MNKKKNKTVVPRTAASAKKKGYSQVEINSKNLTAQQIASRIEIDGVGLRKGHLVSIMQDRDDPNSVLAEYTTGDGGSIYMRIPKGQPVPRDIDV